MVIEVAGLYMINLAKQLILRVGAIRVSANIATLCTIYHQISNIKLYMMIWTHCDDVIGFIIISRIIKLPYMSPFY